MTETIAERRPKAIRSVALGLLPWLAAYAGAYVLHSAPAAFVLYHTLCVVAGVQHGRGYGPRLHNPLARRGWVGLAAAGLAVCFGTYAALGFIGAILEPGRVAQALTALGITARPIALVVLFAYFAVVNPIAEELFWRGTVYVRLRKAGWSLQQSALANAVLFGSWHWLIIRLFFRADIALLLTVGVAVAGYLFARLYERLRSLPALMFIHALAADVPILIALWYVLSKHG